MGQVRRRLHRRAHCDQVKTKKHNGSGEATPAPSCPLRPSKNKRCAPAGSSHLPSHGRSPWDYFYSFCRGSRALPMLFPFHIRNPCGERESFQTRILGSYGNILGKDILGKAKTISGKKTDRTATRIDKDTMGITASMAFPSGTSPICAAISKQMPYGGVINPTDRTIVVKTPICTGFIPAISPSA